MTIGDLPASAAWQHEGGRAGFESMFAMRTRDGYRLVGATAAVEGGHVSSVQYDIVVDEAWCTTSARITGWSENGPRAVLLEADGSGGWRVDGHAAPQLDGCLDIDLEASACTNTLPVHRIGLAVGQGAEAPAAFVRALDMSVARLEQRYERVTSSRGAEEYDYSAPGFDFRARLVYDEAGLILQYPGIARRVH